MASIRKKPSGKYEAQVRIKGLRPLSRTFTTKKLAIQFVREVEGDSELARKLGAPVVKALTFQQLSDMYMSHIKEKIRQPLVGWISGAAISDISR